jgi:Nucleoside-diphosphate-sugar epimerases
VKALLLGGGVFVGRLIVEDALTRGWDVTVLTRGLRPLPEYVGQLTHLLGDRRAMVGNLAGTWDAVIDTCGYRPGDVTTSVQALATRTGCYAFISSASVYSNTTSVGDEALDLAVPVGPEAMDPGRARDYGPLKVACEHAVREVVGDRALVLRPGLIVGPHDPTDRFGYWPQRMSFGGDVLAPGCPSDLVQLIDGRDHAAFVNRCLESAVFGTFNVVSEPQPLLDVLAACTPPRTDARLHWIDSRLLRLNRVQPWTELPLWQGAQLAPRIATASAVSAGLSVRPLSDTAADTLAWERTRAEPFPRHSQLSSERERELLTLYG